MITGLPERATATCVQLLERFGVLTREALRSAGLAGGFTAYYPLLKAMEQAETLAALLEELRNVINLESDAISDVKRRIRTREDSLFKPKKKKD